MNELLLKLREEKRAEIHSIVSQGCRLCDYWDAWNYHCMLNIPIHPAYPCNIADQILVLIPDIEYLTKQLKLADKNYLELKNAFDERIEEAKNDERERIGKELDNHFAGRLESEQMAVGRVWGYIGQAPKEEK